MEIKGSRWTLKTKLLVSITFIAIYPIVLVVIVGFLNYENVVKERFFDSTNSEMTMVTKYLNQEVENMDNFMIGLLYDQGIYELLNREKQVISSLDAYNFERDMEGYLRSAIASKVDFDAGGIYLYDSGGIYFSAKRTGFFSVNDFPYLAINEAFEEGKNKVTYIDEGDIFLGRRILDKDTFLPLGIMMFRINPESLSTMVGERGEQSISTNYLLTKTGEIISYSGTGGHLEFIEEAKLFLENKGNYELTYEGIDYYVSISEADLLGFVFIRITTKEALLDDLQKVTDLIVILSVINLPLYALIGNWIYKSITNPVGKLVEGMEAFEKGQLGVVIESTRKDEFGYMIETFNSMTQTMKKLINEVYVEELARKDAEISALQEQINPHFLYNTLESINWRAQIAGEMDIAYMIQALSVIMEANINRDQRKMVPLERELYYMDQYIYLIQMRFGDKIQYHKEVSDEAMTCMMPKMVLQPLLENAIKHGIEPIGRGKISLSAWVEEQVLVLQVTDTGKGMNYTQKSMVQRIFTQEAKATGIVGTTGSIGLRNVARRLFLLYDQKVTLEVSSKLDEGTTIHIRLPVAKETDHESKL